jgi:hypothetical protein
LSTNTRTLYSFLIADFYLFFMFKSIRTYEGIFESWQTLTDAAVSCRVGNLWAATVSSDPWWLATPSGWVPNFIACNPRIASVVGRTIKSARTTGANYETIRAFIQLFKRTRIELGIQYEDIWNMDETGVALEVCTNHQVLASSSKKKAYTKSPEDREWMSIIEACSAPASSFNA